MLIEHGEDYPEHANGAILVGHKNGQEAALVAAIPEEVTAAMGSIATLAANGAHESHDAVANSDNHETNRDYEVFRVNWNPKTYEVHVESDITLEDYERITPPEDMKLLKEWAKPMQGKVVDFLNPTV